MAWFTRDRRHEAPAEQVAQDLFLIMVGEEPEYAQPEKFHVPAPIWPKFGTKMRLYREATVLMLLLSHAQKETKYEEVLKSYESRILPATPTPEGISKLQALKTAMQHINDLVDPKGERREFSWSMAWFNDITHAETNPVTLALFSTYWMDYYVAVAKTLADIRPI